MTIQKKNDEVAGELTDILVTTIMFLCRLADKYGANRNEIIKIFFKGMEDDDTDYTDFPVEVSSND